MILHELGIKLFQLTSVEGIVFELLKLGERCWTFNKNARNIVERQYLVELLSTETRQKGIDTGE